MRGFDDREILRGRGFCVIAAALTTVIITIALIDLAIVRAGIGVDEVSVVTLFGNGVNYRVSALWIGALVCGRAADKAVSARVLLSLAVGAGTALVCITDVVCRAGHLARRSRTGVTAVALLVSAEVPSIRTGF